MARRAARHAERVRQATQLAEAPPSKSRRPQVRQGPRRELEQAIRRDVAAFRRWCNRHGLLLDESAARLGLCPRTLSSWDSWRSVELACTPYRGRPIERPSIADRNLIILLFGLMGPGVGVPSLQKCFPEVPRRELEDIVRRYRYIYRRRGRCLLHTLDWQQAGTVWAMDYTDPPTAVDGTYKKILVVRDLSSGMQLLSLPLEVARGTAVRDALVALFLEHGAPVVLKSDNDSTFTTPEVEHLLALWGILPLLSPPGTPQYNGACEAGVGSLKTRAHHEAARHGRPGEWTCDDVEAARQMANETARPRGLAGPTPNQAWEGRCPISSAQRQLFAATVERLRKEVLEEQNKEPVVDRISRERASIDRVAIGRALIELGYLELRRRRVSPPITRPKRANIS